MPKLSEKQIEIRNAWLHDVFVWGGLSSTPKRPQPWLSVSRYSYMYGTSNSNDKDGKAAAKTVCDFVKARPTDYNSFQDTWKALDLLSRRHFANSIANPRQYTIKDPGTLARYLASFIFEKQLWIDDSAMTTYEITALEPNPLFQVLRNFGCFTSQAPAAKTRTRSASSASNAGSTSSGNSAPASGYKASGGHAGEIPNLLNSSKEYLSGKVYCVEADKQGKNQPCAYITPLQVSGNTIKPISKAQAEKIKFGSANGYADCKLWFETQTEVVDFINNFLIPHGFDSKWLNIRQASAKADQNGYFRVSTEAGYAFIKASRLNEELVEAVDKYANATFYEETHMDEIEAFAKSLA